MRRLTPLPSSRPASVRRVPARRLAAGLLGLIAALCVPAVRAAGFVDAAPFGAGTLLDTGAPGAVVLGSAGAASVVEGPFRIANAGGGVMLGDTAVALDLGANGTWRSLAPWAGDAGGAPMGAYVNGIRRDDNAVTFTLAAGERAAYVGLRYIVDLSEPPPGFLRLTVYDTRGTLLGSSLPLSPATGGGVNESALVGFVSEAGDIGSFMVSGAHHAYGDIRYVLAVPGPEPALWLLALPVLAAVRRTRRRRSVSMPCDSGSEGLARRMPDAL